MSNPAPTSNISVSTIRGLAIDMVQKANSGHPGLPLGAAPMAYALWSRHLKFDPKDPRWFNRDRFILSAGHGSALLYALLHCFGYDLTLDDLKNFRQWKSRTPGHPENTLTPGVEMATGPLGQGLSTSVGFAIAERYLGQLFNRPGHSVIDHFTYGVCSDGDLMEGVACEAASLAGHLGLGKLIFLYDDNGITLDTVASASFTEDVAARYQALGWHTETVAEGMDVDAVSAAIDRAKAVTDKPSLLLCKTIIGFGSPNKAGSSKSHGSPLGPDEVKLTKQALGLPVDHDFYVAPEAAVDMGAAVGRGARLHAAWDAAFAAYEKAEPELATSFNHVLAGDLGTAWIDALPTYGPDDKPATRQASAKAIQAFGPLLPSVLGGAADLSESNLTEIKGAGQFQIATPEGRNLFFGVREHAMVAALNGIQLHGGLRAFGGTFLTFSDYCRGSIRLAALMECPTILVFTHDSIGLGEDGPTHQPVEHVMALRAIPNLNVMRPADGNETSACWKVALESKHTPSALILTRQGLPTLTPATVKDHPAEKGAYTLMDAEGGEPHVVLIGVGSELQLAVKAREELIAKGVKARVVSMPSWLLFERQSKAYRLSVLPREVPAVSVEAGVTLGWDRYAEAHVGVDKFGASAPGDLLMREYGITTENVVAMALAVVAK